MIEFPSRGTIQVDKMRISEFWSGIFRVIRYPKSLLKISRFYEIGTLEVEIFGPKVPQEVKSDWFSISGYNSGR